MSPPWRNIMGRINITGDSQDFTLESELSLPGLGQGLPRGVYPEHVEGLAMIYRRFSDFLRDRQVFS